MNKKFKITVQCVFECEAKDPQSMLGVLEIHPIETFTRSGCHYKLGSYKISGKSIQQKIIDIEEIK